MLILILDCCFRLAIKAVCSSCPIIWRNESVTALRRSSGTSAGPIKTLAAAGINSVSKILKFVEDNAPLRRNVTTDDVGNVAAFLMSDLAAGITGEITYVDAGFNTVVGGIRGEA